ncbi:MAG: hypothetical protein LWX00_09660 [Spirochaetia bacterium]|nr:hypothetical protein [Spirochaetia bacterium]
MKKTILFAGVFIALFSGCLLNPYNYTAFHDNFNHDYTKSISLNFVRGTLPKLEISVSADEGALEVSVINPKGQKIYVTEISNNASVQKIFNYMQGLWSVGLKSIHGSGSFAFKFHDKAGFEGF